MNDKEEGVGRNYIPYLFIGYGLSYWLYYLVAKCYHKKFKTVCLYVSYQFQYPH